MTATPAATEPSRSVEPNRVIVTGADSGIGKASAVALAAPGRHVAVTWNTDVDGAERTAVEIRERGATAHVRHLDLTDPSAGAGVVDDLASAMGGVDALVMSSGTGTSELLLDISLERWREVLSVDLDGAFMCLQAAARHMIAGGNGGRIVAITSVHEHAPRVGAGPYCAAKGGLGLLIKVAALELAEHGITVNAVAPGEIATPMTGQEDESALRGKERPASRSPGLETPGRSRPSSRSCAARRPATSTARRGLWTAACCRWDPWQARTFRATTGAAPDRRQRPEPSRPAGRRHGPACRRHGQACRRQGPAGVRRAPLARRTSQQPQAATVESVCDSIRTNPSRHVG